MTSELEQKAADYDWLVKEIHAREPSIGRLLSGSTSGYKHAPLQALLRAFDLAVDDNKRYRLGDYDPPAVSRQRRRARTEM